MSGSLNRAQLIGHLGGDPEIRTTQSGSKVATFSLATSETWRDKNTGEKRESTEWHRIVVFNEGLVKVVEQYAKKGAKILVEGNIRTRKWQDQQGQDRYSTEIVLQFDARILLLDRANGSGYRPGGDSPEDYGRQSSREQASTPSHDARSLARDMDDDIPF